MNVEAGPTGREAPHDVRRFLSLLHRAGDTFEIRVPKVGKYRLTAAGYFDDLDVATAAATSWDGHGNVYVTLNPVSPALLARSVNRMLERADATTSDADILHRRSLFIDIDPVRPSGISSTQDELAAALALGERVRDALAASGWPEPIGAMSGNGCYLVYRIDLPNDGQSNTIVAGVLKALAERFDIPEVHVDTTVANAGRIIGVVGTTKKKGDPTADRPHRRSYIIHAPDELGVVTRAQLEALVTPTTETTIQATAVGGRLDDILRNAGIDYREQPPDANGVTWYHVKQCPLHDDGRPFECGVGQTLPDGPYAGHCFHPEGVGRGWQDFKRALGLDASHHNPAIVSADRTPPLSDAGNGESFAELYGDRVRYDHRRRRWLIWDAHRWDADADGEVRRLAKMAVRHRGLAAFKVEDLTRRSQIARFAIQSEHRQRIDALLVQAQSEPPIADDGRHWDEDPLLLAASNGVIDLAMGSIRPGRPSDRITLQTPVLFDPNAACPRWERFLLEIFEGNVELVEFIQTAVGYSLTGLTSEQCLFLCYGTGANGKSVFLTILRALAGLYAYNAAFSLFEMHQRNAIPNDVAALVNRRLVTSSETNEGTRLNEARVKALTGCDPITARFLHAEFFTYEPVAKFWLAVNHKPTVRDDSHGFWRRVRLIPFMRQFNDAEADRELANELRGELPGILAWAVRGTARWQHRGLPEPDVVRAATDHYRAESDPLFQFLNERCVKGEGLTVGSSDLFRAYLAWGMRQGMKDRELLNATLFGKRMGERFAKGHARAGNHYIGLALEHQGTVIVAVPDDEDAPFQDDVKGSVKGLESDGHKNEVFSPVDRLTRENTGKPFTTLHPFTEGPWEPCRGGCGALVPPGQKCSPCADAAVEEWGQQ